jgi:hypothetical protein
VYPFSNSYQSVDVNAIIYIAFTSFQCQLLSVSTSFLKMNLNSSCCFDLYRCVGDKPSTNGDLKYLKYCIKIEKTTIIDLSSTQKKNIYIRSGCLWKRSFVIEILAWCCKKAVQKSLYLLFA